MHYICMSYIFEWDGKKDLQNTLKHGIDFLEDVQVFADPDAIYLEDENHSSDEDRFYAVGKIKSGMIITVRYTVREKTIRIFGAANWRKWRKYYEEENS